MEKQELLRRVLDRLNQVTGSSEPVADAALEPAVFRRLDQTEKIVGAIRQYLPKRVIDKILLNPDGVKVEGERRPVTVLFGDLSGFTAMSETLDPEQVVEVVNQYFDTMVEIAERYGGHIDKFMGDALMVLFGAPVVHEDDPLRACLAAVEMLEAMDRFSAERKMDLAMSIGLNTGEVVALNVGSKGRMEYTVIGDGVNLAARLEKVATARQCVIGENTYRQVKGKIRLQKLKPVMVKGKSKPQNVYLILGRAETAETAAGLRAGSIPMVGRMAEMDAVRAAVAKAKDGAGQVVAITGGPGLGKSRLAKELELLARDEKFGFAKGKCYSYAAGVAYLPFLRQLQLLLGVQDKDAPGRKREKLVEKLQALDLADFEPFLGSLLGISYPEIADLDPEKRKRRTFDGFTGLFRKEAGRRPLALAFEDLQWADSLTLELLEHLVDAVADQPVLVCCDYRPELALPFVARPHCTSIVLAPLDQREVFKMVSALAGTADVADQVLGKVAERTEGNPLFIEEITRHLLSRRLVKREGENLVASKRFGTMALPTTVAGVVLGRIDKLSEELRRTLQYAAVIGKEFDHELLAHITRTPADQLRPRLDNLEHFEGLLYSKEVEGRRYYQFHSTTTQEAAYGTLLKGRRKELHGTVALTYERDYKDDLEPWLEDLAHHFFHSTYEDKAVQYLHAAGDKARGLYANETAIEFYQKGRDLCKKQKVTQQTQMQLAEFYGAQGAVLRLIGERERALKNFVAAAKISQKYNETTVSNKYVIETGISYDMLGEQRRAVQLWKKTCEAAIAAHDLFAAASTLNLQGIVDLRNTDIDKAIQFFQRSAEMFVKLGEKKQLSRVYGNLGQAYDSSGQTEKAIEQYQAALEAATACNYLEGAAMVNNDLGNSFLALGDIERAEEHLMESLRRSKQIGDKRVEGLSSGSMGILYAMTGRYRESMESFTTSLTAAEETNDPRQIVMMNINIGCVHQTWGDAGKAIAHHNRAFELSKQFGDLPNEIESRRNIGIDLLINARYREALEEQNTALTEAQKVGDPRIEAYVSACVGLLQVIVGQPSEAETTLQKALDLARQVGDPEVILAAARGRIELHITRGEFDEALQHIERAGRLADESQNMREKAYIDLSHAIVLMRQGDLEAMSGPLAEVLDINHEIEDKVLQCRAALVGADRAIGLKSFPEAERYLDEAGELSRSLTMPDLLWRVYLAKGQLYQRQGLADGAKEQLALARLTVEDMKPQVPEGMWEGFINNTERKMVYQTQE
ncbi:MAG: tetratricopeptide repeat protein [Candidatus Edwardsbacteria bacterium]|nr:tetratricopeptide repeat protein [Candidatus Edwardsbacteria bacterium]